MSAFADLMKLSASQTKESQNAVQLALAQRERKEEARRKQQEEQERKQRELDHKMRLKYFEDQKKEQERKLRQQEEEQARELTRQRREKEQRDALRYGPKKARAAAASRDASPKWPSSNSQAQSRETVRKRRPPSDDEDTAGGSSGTGLTRQEKRDLKKQAELNQTFRQPKRTKHHNNNNQAKAGKLEGAAFNIITTPGVVNSDSAPQSVKARIAALPITLTKLNVVKRDTRTIDEILQDRAKARDVKVLNGDEAREFSDWFGRGKKKEPVKPRPQRSTPSSTPDAGTPVPQGASSKTDTVAFNSTSRASSKVPQPGTKPHPHPTGTKASSTLSKPSRATTAAMSAMSAIKPKASTAGVPNGRSSAKKRPRTPSISESPSPPAKRRTSSANDIGEEIWKMFGKNRSSYVERDVASDDDDMEADARILEREELRSSRIARAEEEAALAAEKRHEEEKRRRKKEKELLREKYA